MTAHFNATHNDTGTAEHRAWNAMRARCTSPSHDNFGSYGGRGISICERWESYENFLEDMGRKPTPAHSIDREDNNGNYEPDNCRWATPKEQCRNRSNNMMLTLNGRTMCAPEWADELSIKLATIHSRIQKGWSDHRVLSTPVRPTPTLTHDGRTLSYAGWSKETGIASSTIRNRIHQGWTPERILTTPVRVRP